jgi:hypothetical protein
VEQPEPTTPEPAGAPHAPTCAACGVAMEEGVLLDHAHFGFAYPASWKRGPFRGLGRLNVSFGKLAVKSFRCPRCARVELYAPAVVRGPRKPL